MVYKRLKLLIFRWGFEVLFFLGGWVDKMILLGRDGMFEFIGRGLVFVWRLSKVLIMNFNK